MSKLRILLSVVMALFLFESSAVVYMMGYVGFFEAANANPATRLLMLDLVICLSMIAVWIWRDARERGVSPLPYLVVAATFGAAGPLLYLIRRPKERRVAPNADARATQPA